MTQESLPPSSLKVNLEHSSQEALLNLLKDPSTDGALLDQIVKLHARNEPLMEIVLTHPRALPQTLLYLYNAASPEFKERMRQSPKAPSAGAGESAASKNDPGAEPSPDIHVDGSDELSAETLSLFQQVQRMKVSDKVKLALHGGKDARSLLLKDPNRQVYQAVLASPKITEDEIHLIAQSRNVSDEILRSVGRNKEWLKNYSILFALVSNPKTPLAVSMPLIPSLREKDLGLLSRNRNIPEAIRMGAVRLLSAKRQK